LVALPLKVNKGYSRLIYNRTSSPRLLKVLRKLGEERRDAPEQRRDYLTYEFAHQQINLSSRYLKRDPPQGEIFFDKEKATLSAVSSSTGQHRP
jgi:hypothetical protein